MFSSRNQLVKRTPENGTDRESFLSLLVDEYLHSASYDAKCQVLANLSNFAYDPINYQYIRDVGVLDIFLYVIKHESNRPLIHYAVAGLCNLSLDPINAEYIKLHCGLEPLTALLKLDDACILADTITTLIQLNESQACPEIRTEEVKKNIFKIKNSSDHRLSNLATIYLQDVCSIHENL